ncbi:MAG: isoprenylcysteine carboxylmethyltransferase family protein [Phycisphaerales bacterium]|nr:MAG: isoprenylcysteine carboxylmethyltransferase family protein [Phycisphaerales bacterium]
MLNVGLRVLVAIALFVGIVFGCAGRWDLPFAWAYLAVLLCVLVTTLIVADRDLLQERMKPGPGGSDRKLRFVAAGLFLGHLVVAALDAGRFHWSGSVPVGLQFAGLAGLAMSMALSVWALHVNRFFSPVVRIQSERGHCVITDGPYRWIRHPGYAAALMSSLCSGPTLGSWWSILVLAPMFVLTIRRTVIEDRYLRERLEGYVDYAQRVRYRLAPGVW